MYPFYVNGEKLFSFSYKPEKGDVMKHDQTGEWFKIIKVESGKGRKVYGCKTIAPNSIIN